MSKIKVPLWLGSGKGPLLGYRLTTSPCVPTWRKGLGSSLGLFYKGTNPIHESSTLTTYPLPKGPTS